MVNLPHKNSKLFLIKIPITETIKMVSAIKVLIIITKIVIIITIIMKCRGAYRTPTTSNTELLMTLHNGRKPLSNIKELPLRWFEDSIYASEMTYSSLNVMNRSRPYRLNSLLGTLPHLISQE